MKHTKGQINHVNTKNYHQDQITISKLTIQNQGYQSRR